MKICFLNTTIYQVVITQDQMKMKTIVVYVRAEVGEAVSGDFHVLKYGIDFLCVKMVKFQCDGKFQKKNFGDRIFWSLSSILPIIAFLS